MQQPKVNFQLRKPDKMRALSVTHWRHKCPISNNALRKSSLSNWASLKQTSRIESSFVDDLGADSLDTVELVMALEDEFEMEIPDEQAEKITTVQQAIDYAKAHVKA